MIKRSKKKWKSKRPEVTRVRPVEGINKSRNSLTSSHPNSGGKERQSRNPKKMKSPNNRPKYLWHRSKSVPSKTVSFSPYVLHRFAQAPTRVRADISRSNSCAMCRQKAGAKKSVASKKKPVMDRCSRQPDEQDQCLAADNVSTTYDSFHTARSPGPARCGIEHTYPDFDFRPSQYPGDGHFVHPELSDRSHNYLPPDPNPGSSYGASGSAGSAYLSGFGSKHPPWKPVERSLHTAPGLKNRGSDAKYDFLMAKYSEHNCPKTRPALSDYFSFQRLSLDSAQNLGNVSQNKSPSAHLGAAVSSRSRSKTRLERMSQAGPAGSSLFQYDKYYTGFNASHNYSSGNGCPRADLYQSEAMRDMMYNTLSQKYIDTSSTKGSTHTRNPVTDPEFNVFQKHWSSRRSFPLADTSSAYRSRIGANPVTSKKYEFFDDMCLIGKAYGTAKSFTFPSVVSGIRSGVTQRSRSTDASFFSGLSSYDDKEGRGPGRTALDSRGEYLKSGSRQTGSWMSSYGKMDNLLTPISRLENWKSSYSKLDDTIPSSKYASGSTLQRSSCVNNSNERFPNFRQTSDEYTGPTNSLYCSGWTARNRSSATCADSKNVHSDIFLSRFDESESQKLYDKYMCLGSPNTPASEPTSRIFKDDITEADTRTGISGHSRDYTSLASLAREKSLSPVGRRKRFASNRGNVTSYFSGNDLSFEPKDEFGKHRSLAFEKLPTASECKVSNHDSNHHCHNFSSLSSRNLNMNHTQSTGTKPEFQPSSSTSLNQSWKYHPSNYISEPTSCGFTKPSGQSAVGTCNPRTPFSLCCFESAASILTSMVDQQTDRLKKLAGAIERRQDGSQDINHDFVI